MIAEGDTGEPDIGADESAEPAAHEETTDPWNDLEPEQPAAASAEAEQVEAKGVPFYKRELSFRRKSDVARESIATLDVEAVAPTEALVAVDDDPAELAAVVELDPVAGSDLGDVEVDGSTSTKLRQRSPQTTLPRRSMQDADAHALAGRRARAGSRSDRVPAALPSRMTWSPRTDADVADERRSAVVERRRRTTSRRRTALDLAARDAALVVSTLDAEFSLDDVAESAPDAADAERRLSTETSSDAGPSRCSRIGASDRGRRRLPRRAEARQARQGREKAPEASAGHGAKGRKVVGLKIGASQIAAAVVIETEAGHELIELARRPLETGIVVDGEVRDQDALATCAQGVLRRGEASQEGRSHRPREQPDRRPHVRHRRHRRRDAVRQRRSLQGPRGTPGRASTSRFSTIACSTSARTRPASRCGASSSSSLRATRSSRTSASPTAPGSSSAGSTSRPSACCAPSSSRGPSRPASPTIRRRSSSRSATSRRRCSSPAAVPANSPGSSTGVAGHLVSAIAEALGVQPAEATTILKHLSLSGPGRKYDALDEAMRTKATEAVRLRLDSVCARARELAPVLPDPGRVARHRRHRDHGRHVPARGSRWGTPRDDRCQRHRWRPARAGDRVGEFDPAIEARDRIAGRSDRARDRR